MIELKFDKLYSVDRMGELCNAAIPVAGGKCIDASKVCIYNEDKVAVPSAAKATAKWDDGSVKWLYVDFLANIGANAAPTYYCELCSDEVCEPEGKITAGDDFIDTGVLRVELSTEVNRLFKHIYYNGTENTELRGPVLKTGGRELDFKADKWELEELSRVKAVVIGSGTVESKDKSYGFKVRLSAAVGKPYIELAYTLINTTMESLHIEALTLEVVRRENNTRSTVAHSNYKTKYYTNTEGKRESVTIDSAFLMGESNESFAEVFYGTFFGDITDKSGGVCATVYQAQQNFPKGISVDGRSMIVSLVPEGVGSVVMQDGMAREQRVLLEFHSGLELSELNNHSTIYQMPDRPLVKPEVFKQAGIFSHIIIDNKVPKLEMVMMGCADEHTRAYGMMSWGDAPDMGYTAQGRGKGGLVWTNNEYDFPHACMLQYARTGIRRYLDYVLVAARHWMDVDICHYSDNPLEIGGQWEHTYNHNGARLLACSHEWVEGMLDYYHLTGDREAYNTAVGIGNNVLGLLDTPMFKHTGEVSARETGWALRTLVALYIETGEVRWLEKCDWIVGHFKDWMDKYGLWLSPYTDNVEIRVVFMIAIAVGSLMRYYMVCKSDEVKADIKRMILTSVDDLVENARLDSGLFYYKELPGLQRLGNNPCILEALSIAYELTGDKSYLEVGLPTLNFVVTQRMPRISLEKRVAEDSVLVGSTGTKGFAQMMVPVTKFYKSAAEAGLLEGFR